MCGIEEIFKDQKTQKNLIWSIIFQHYHWGGRCKFLCSVSSYINTTQRYNKTKNKFSMFFYSAEIERKEGRK